MESNCRWVWWGSTELELVSMKVNGAPKSPSRIARHPLFTSQNSPFFSSHAFLAASERSGIFELGIAASGFLVSKALSKFGPVQQVVVATGIKVGLAATTSDSSPL